jgi:hypothetical protein
VVYFIVLGTLVWTQSSVFVDLKEVDVGWVDEKPWAFGRERLYGKDDGGRNGMVVFCSIYVFLVMLK